MQQPKLEESAFDVAPPHYCFTAVTGALAAPTEGPSALPPSNATSTRMMRLLGVPPYRVFVPSAAESARVHRRMRSEHRVWAAVRWWFGLSATPTVHVLHAAVRAAVLGPPHTGLQRDDPGASFSVPEACKQGLVEKLELPNVSPYSS